MSREVVEEPSCAVTSPLVDSLWVAKGMPEAALPEAGVLSVTFLNYLACPYSILNRYASSSLSGTHYDAQGSSDILPESHETAVCH